MGFSAARLAVFACLVLSAGLAFSAQIQTSRPTHTFGTQGKPVKITPIYHTSPLIEVGNESIYIDPAKPANFAGLPPPDLILITDVHGDQFDPVAVAALSTRRILKFWRPPLPSESSRPRAQSRMAR